MANKLSAPQFQENEVHSLRVTAHVAIDSEGDLCCAYSGDIHDDEISVLSEYAEIVLRLESSLGVTFAGNPITWLVTDEPVKVETLKPACFAVVRDSDQQVTIRDWNNEASYGRYRFTINVIHGRNRHVLDPTIVNQAMSMSSPPPTKRLQDFLKFEGKMHWEGDLDELRGRKGRRD